MNQEKFINSYIELLNATLTEAIQKNLVLQTQKKIVEEEIQQNKNNVLEVQNLVNLKEKQIEDLKNQLNQEKRTNQISLSETNELKKSVQHIDTFKSELLKARQEIEKLNRDLTEKQNINNDKQKIIDNLNNEIAALLTKQEEEKEKRVLKKSSVKKISPLELEKSVEQIKDAGNF